MGERKRYDKTSGHQHWQTFVYEVFGTYTEAPGARILWDKELGTRQYGGRGWYSNMRFAQVTN